VPKFEHSSEKRFHGLFSKKKGPGGLYLLKKALRLPASKTLIDGISIILYLLDR